MKVPGYGPANARIMFVGEAPGADEDREGKPFVGAAGQTLRKGLAAVGIDVDGVYLTNICKYRPPQNKIRAWFNDSGRPAHEHVFNGLLELMAEIEKIRPNVIVPLGNYPLAMITGLAKWTKVKDKAGNSRLDYTGIGNWRGSIVESKLVDGFKVVPTFHPSYITREGYADHGIWMADLARIREEAEFPDLRIPEKEFHLDPRGSDWWNLKDRLLADPKQTLTFDIEYIGSDLLCLGVTNHRDLAVVLKTDSASQIKECRDVLLAGNPLNAQNAMFDASILEWWYQMPVMEHIAYDTMLAAHSSNIELPKGLDFLCSIFTRQRYYKDMIDWNKVKAGLQPISEVLHYNAIDVWTQHEIMEEQIIHDLSEPAVRRTFEFEMTLLKALWPMSKRGVRVNVEKVHALKEELEEDIRVRNEVLNMVCGRKINVKSGPDIRHVLFEKLGLKPGRKTKTGPATDDKTLAEVKLQTDDPFCHKVIELIRSIRKNRDLISKFLEIQFDADGRMRGHYNPGGTKTGRLASKKFYPTGTGGNQQNIPTDERARSMFIADGPLWELDLGDPPAKRYFEIVRPTVADAMLFGYADLERAESLVVSHLTQDPEMLRVHGKGIDAHKELAARLFNKDVSDITKDERYIGKRTRHAGNYMMGPKTFMAQVNKDANKTGVAITYSQARDYIQIYRDTHPFLQRWWDEVERELWKSRTLYTLLGRKRIFYGHVRSIVPEAVAFNPQGTVGDTLNIALLNLEGIPSPYMVELEMWKQVAEWAAELKEYGYQSLMQIHDAVAFQVREKEAERALWLVEKLMTIPLTIPKTLETFAIPVEILVGPNWGNLIRAN